MLNRRRWLRKGAFLLFFLVLSSTRLITGQEHADDTLSNAEDTSQVRHAAMRALELIERSSAHYLTQRQCYSCHHQTLTVIVGQAAREVGLEVDEDNFRRQVERIREYHQPRLSEYLAAKDNGEQVHTLGYGLWGLDVGGHPEDQLTDAIVDYLLAYQQDSGHWLVGLDRRPAEASHFTTNYLAVRAVKRFGRERHRPRAEVRLAAVQRWLEDAQPRDMEDQVFRLRLAPLLEMPPTFSEAVVAELLNAQRPDGGWAQTSERRSDAYATANVLVALNESGDVAASDTNWQRGLRYLLRTQEKDGSWHVVTRAKPMQEYFETGFPHGKDQFVSAYATGWALKALLIDLQETTE